MKIYKLLRIGEHHINHCEDYAVVEQLGQNRMLCAVMDGCTMGTDSYFASTLAGKVLRKIAVEKNYQSFYDKSAAVTVEGDVKEILQLLFAELKLLKGRLLLKDDELLTTLILLVFDAHSGKGRVITIGDGLLCIDGQLIEYEQDNRPDYLGYHLGADFEEWYDKQTQIITRNGFSDISLSTDGIFTFASYDKNEYMQNENPINYLLIDRQDVELESMLNKKLLFLERQCGVKPTDDLGIIRIIKDK